MTKPSLTFTPVSAIEVLGKCLTLTNENYQLLLNDPESYSLCVEAGRSLRRLSKHYADVLVAALRHQTNANKDVSSSDEEEEQDE